MVLSVLRAHFREALSEVSSELLQCSGGIKYATFLHLPQTDNSSVCAEGLIFSKFGKLCGRTREKKVCILHRHDHMHESL